MRTNRPPLAPFIDALNLAHVDPDAPQPLCDERTAEFVDYDVSPGEEAAAALCVDADGEECPLMKVCRESARYERPEWGVRAGVAWKGGKQLHWLTKLGHLPATTAEAA